MTSINSNRKSLSFGIGINDAEYFVRKNINGKQVTCPFYVKWSSMLRRCYSPLFQSKNPTYNGCKVSKDWLSFMSFREWMNEQDWLGNALDKDLLIKGNKIYSPETCLFVPHWINNLTCERDRFRGKYPLGVCFDRSSMNYKAQIRLEKKMKNLGRFSTSVEAATAYKIAKKEKLREAAFQQSDYKTAKALLSYTP